MTNGAPSRATLADARACLEGVMPAVVATCAADGTPNVTYLSKVTYVDDEHVALSNQFFSKTVANVAENPRAQVTVLDPNNGRQFRFDVEFVRRETEGEIFEQLRAEIDAIATIFRQEHLFRLRAADIYRVVRGEPVPSVIDSE